MGIDTRRRHAVFLDRDGVINRAVIRDGKPYPPGRVASVELVTDAAEVLHRIKSAGYLTIVVTNQPDVARGTQSRAVVESIHDYLSSVLPIDEFRCCYHDDRDECHCRKPKPGLILDAALAHDVDLSASVMVGDRWRDVEAGRRAGCRTVFIDYGYTERKPDAPDLVVRTLSDALDWIVALHPPEKRP